MIGAWFKAQPKVRREEGCAELSDQFFEGVGSVPETPIKRAIEPVFGTGPMN